MATASLRRDPWFLRKVRQISVAQLARRLLKLTRLLRVPRYRRALRYGVAATVEHRAVPFLPGIRSVIDVGANRGQFAVFALHRFPEAAIDCFEPLPAARDRLSRVVVGAERVRVHGVALAAEAGDRVLHVARKDDSSSLLPITERQIAAFPDTDEVARLSVDVARLDEVITTAELARPSLLKIDVQGSELDVLRGAERLLPAIDQALVECSFVELYEGQSLADEVIGFLTGRGWRFDGAYSVVYDRDGTCLQADLLFTRPDPAKAGAAIPRG